MLSVEGLPILGKYRRMAFPLRLRLGQQRHHSVGQCRTGDVEIRREADLAFVAETADRGRKQAPHAVQLLRVDVEPVHQIIETLNPVELARRESRCGAGIFGGGRGPLAANRGPWAQANRPGLGATARCSAGRFAR